MICTSAPATESGLSPSVEATRPPGAQGRERCAVASEVKGCVWAIRPDGGDDSSKLTAVVDDIAGTEAANERSLLVGACGRDHVDAASSEELHRKCTDPAGGAGDQHGLTRVRSDRVDGVERRGPR